MLRATDVTNTQFTATKFREGYDVVEVDDFLDTISATLRSLEAGRIALPDGSPLLTPAQVGAQRFHTTKFREGYEVEEVDNLLDSIVETLKIYIGRVQRGEDLVSGEAMSPAGSPQSVPAQSVPAPLGIPVPAEPVPVPVPTEPAPVEGYSAPAGAMGAQDFLRDLQYQRATMFGDARESLRFQTPDGTTLSPMRVEKTPEGLIIHVE